MQEAINNLRTEMDANKDNSYIQYVGDFLLKHIEENPHDAEKILVEGKSIGKSLDAMRKVAENKKSGNVAMLTPEEGIKVVLEYFEIKSQVEVKPTDINSSVPETTEDSEFDVKLEDLL